MPELFQKAILPKAEPAGVCTPQQKALKLRKNRFNILQCFE